VLSEPAAEIRLRGAQKGQVRRQQQRRVVLVVVLVLLVLVLLLLRLCFWQWCGRGGMSSVLYVD